jgi:hypothetical protein
VIAKWYDARKMTWYLKSRAGPGARSLHSASLAVALLGFACAGHGQSSDLDAVAQETAVAIRENTRNLKGTGNVMVLNFRIMNDGLPSVDLGRRLADQFETALKKNDDGFIVIDRDETLSKNATASGDENACPSRASPNLTVGGSVEIRPGGELTLRVELIKGKKVIFHKQVTLTPGPDVLRSEPDPTAWPAAVRGRVAWVRPKDSYEKEEKPIRIGKDDQRYKEVGCVRCPSAPFSRQAADARVQGNVVLDVEVSSHGLPMAIGVVKAVPCGLTTQAVESVKRWIFTPAKGEDGDPVASLVTVEVMFRLY